MYGNWSNEVGLNIVSDEKWSRRRDLMGIDLRSVHAFFLIFIKILHILVFIQSLARLNLDKMSFLKKFGLGSFFKFVSILSRFHIQI